MSCVEATGCPLGGNGAIFVKNHCSCCQVTYARLGSIATRIQLAVRNQQLHLLIFRTCAAAMESILCIYTVIQARCIDRHLLGCNRCE